MYYYQHNAIFTRKKITIKGILSAMDNIFSLMCNLTNSVNSSLIRVVQSD